MLVSEWTGGCLGVNFNTDVAHHSNWRMVPLQRNVYQIAESQLVFAMSFFQPRLLVIPLLLLCNRFEHIFSYTS